MQVIQGSLRSRGLVGLPVLAGGHWTLVVVINCRELMKVSYYDSSNEVHTTCREKAQKLLKLLEVQGLEEDLAERRNRVFRKMLHPAVSGSCAIGKVTCGSSWEKDGASDGEIRRSP